VKKGVFPMKKLVAIIIFASVLVLTITTTALAEVIVPPVVVPGTGYCGGDIEEFPGGFVAFGCQEFNTNGYKFLPYNNDPEETFGPANSYYVTGAINIYALQNAKRVPEFSGLVEICFWDTGAGTVKFWTGSDWQIMPTYVYEGFRCTTTKVPGWYAVIALDWE
jgi:hypothetical protein